jgi:hypothetical protein
MGKGTESLTACGDWPEATLPTGPIDGDPDSFVEIQNSGHCVASALFMMVAGNQTSS